MWLVVLAITAGLMAVAAWQLWNHWRLDARIAECDPGLLSSELYKVETSTDAPAGSMVLPYIPVRVVSTSAPTTPQTASSVAPPTVAPNVSDVPSEEIPPQVSN